MKRIFLFTFVLLLFAGPQVHADDATVRITITNNGADVKGYGMFALYPPGEKKAIASSSSGGVVTVPEGKYEILVRFEEGAAKKEIRLPKETLGGNVEKSVEVDLPLARVTFRITDSGDPTGPDGTYSIYPPGERKKELGYAASGESATIPVGTYDVLLRLRRGTERKSVWMLKQKLEGTVEQTMDMGPLPPDPPEKEPSPPPPETKPTAPETRPESMPAETLPAEAIPVVSLPPSVETQPIAPETVPVVPLQPPPPVSPLPQPPEFLLPVPGEVPQTSLPPPSTPAKGGWFGCGLVPQSRSIQR